MGGQFGKAQAYVVPLNMCQVCAYLFDRSRKFQLECSTRAAEVIARSGLEL